jgi:1-acyl-sn-glycerol-3-phosphate acyltransferase
MKKWLYDSVRDVDQAPIDRLRQFPREPDMLVYGLRSLGALIIRGLLHIYNHFEIIGHQNLRTNRSLVIVANHCSHIDTLCLLAALPLRKLHRAFPAAASDYFFQSVPRLWAAAILVNALPFARQARVRQSLSLCRELLANPGTILIIFPEGTRSTTGEVGEFKSGIGALVAGRDVALRRVSSMDHFRHGLKANDFRAREKFDCRWNASQLSRSRNRQDRHLRDCRRTARCGERIAPSKWKPLKELSLVGTVPSCFIARGFQIRQRTKRCCFFIVVTSIPVVGKKRSIPRP